MQNLDQLGQKNRIFSFSIFFFGHPTYKWSNIVKIICSVCSQNEKNKWLLCCCNNNRCSKWVWAIEWYWVSPINSFQTVLIFTELAQLHFCLAYRNSKLLLIVSHQWFCDWEKTTCGFIYILIAFDERVTFWLQHVRSLPCARAYVALFVRRLAYNHYAIAHTYNAANTYSTRQWLGALKPKSYSLVKGNRSIIKRECWTNTSYFVREVVKNLLLLRRAGNNGRPWVHAVMCDNIYSNICMIIHTLTL